MGKWAVARIEARAGQCRKPIIAKIAKSLAEMIGTTRSVAVLGGSLYRVFANHLNLPCAGRAKISCERALSGDEGAPQVETHEAGLTCAIKTTRAVYGEAHAFQITAEAILVLRR